MYLSNSCLAEAYCQDAYTPENHDIIAEAFCRAIKTYDPEKGDFRTWVGIQRSGVVRQNQRFLRRAGYLEEVYAANEDDADEISHLDKSCNFIFDSFNLPSDDFLTSPEAILMPLSGKSRKDNKESAQLHWQAVKDHNHKEIL